MDDRRHRLFFPQLPSFKAVLRCGIVLAFLLVFAGGNDPYARSAVTKLTALDYFQIYNLYSAYSVALDTGNGPGRVATFTPDGTFSWGRSKHTPEAMDIVLKRTNAYGQRKRPAGMYHILMNIHITPTPEGANGTCYMVGRGRTAPHDANGNYALNTGFYSDTLVKTPEGWRFKTREFWDSSEEVKASREAK
jgi:hypothetical protein